MPLSPSLSIAQGCWEWHRHVGPSTSGGSQERGIRTHPYVGHWLECSEGTSVTLPATGLGKRLWHPALPGSSQNPPPHGTSTHGHPVGSSLGRECAMAHAPGGMEGIPWAGEGAVTSSRHAEVTSPAAIAPL